MKLWLLGQWLTSKSGIQRTQLGEDARQVAFHRLLVEIELQSDALVANAIGDESSTWRSWAVRLGADR